MDKNKKVNKSVSLDDLAVMIKDGFDKTATKQDLKEAKLDLKADIAKLDERVQTVETKLDRALYTEAAHLETST